MRKISLLIVSAALIACFCPQVLRAQTPSTPDDKPSTQPRKRGGIFTMYAMDPLSRNLCFSDGKEGMAFVNHKWENRCSDLSYTQAGGGSFVTGIELNRSGAIVDLGTANDLRGRYSFEDAENGGVGFASLRVMGGKIMILQDDIGKTPATWQPLQEASQLAETKSSATAPIKLGHIYLVRITDSRDKNYEQLVKLLVVAYRNEEAVTLRWELL
ncbi:MAG TPA: hypothetical protein VN844_30140 [Pyrinomonadaceae bacterium]|nr:hypothetical protein [Pyrinomonadaceae bacterium]